MNPRVFVSTQDINLNQWNAMAMALHTLLESIIMPKFDWFQPADLYITKVRDSGNDLEIEISIGNSVNVNTGESRTESDFVVGFALNYQSINNHIVSSMTPTVKSELTTDSGLTPDQFIVKLVSFVEILPKVSVVNNSEEVVFTQEVILTLVINIEDISVYEPGQEVPLLLRYEFLCSDKSLQSDKELREWVNDLDIYDPTTIGSAGREELCDAIRTHYGF